MMATEFRPVSSRRGAAAPVPALPRGGAEPARGGDPSSLRAFSFSFRALGFRAGSTAALARSSSLAPRRRMGGVA